MARIARIPGWMRNKWVIIAIILFVFSVIATLNFFGRQIGYKTLFWDIPVGAFILMLIATLIAVLTIKGYGRETYRIAGVLALYLLFHLLWGHFSPISFKAATYFASFWIFEFVFLTSFALLGKAAICGWIINLATLAVLVVSVYCMISIFFTADGSRKIADFLNNNIERNVYRAFFVKIQETNKESVVEKPLFEKMERNYQEAKIGKLRPEAKEQIDGGIEAAYPEKEEEAEKEKEGKGKGGRVLSGVFEVPAGEIVYTGLIRKKGEYTQYEQIQKSLGKFYLVGEQYNSTIKERRETFVATKEGEVQLKGGPKPVKVSVRIIR